MDHTALGIPRNHGEVRSLPRSQVRSDFAGRILPVAGVSSSPMMCASIECRERSTPTKMDYPVSMMPRSNARLIFCSRRHSGAGQRACPDARRAHGCSGSLWGKSSLLRFPSSRTIRIIARSWQPICLRRQRPTSNGLKRSCEEAGRVCGSGEGACEREPDGRVREAAGRSPINFRSPRRPLQRPRSICPRSRPGLRPTRRSLPIRLIPRTRPWH